MSQLPSAIVIENLRPRVDDGRHPVKRVTGDTLRVSATIFKEGHDRLRAVAKVRPKGDTAWQEAPLRLVNPGLDSWEGELPLPDIGRFEYTVEAWTVSGGAKIHH